MVIIIIVIIIILSAGKHTPALVSERAFGVQTNIHRRNREADSTTAANTTTNPLVKSIYFYGPFSPNNLRQSVATAAAALVMPLTTLRVGDNSPITAHFYYVTAISITN